MNNFKYKKVKNFLSRDELNLLTTYCKLRHKTNFNTFADLAPHSDRPSCEYSVTVMIDSDKTDWPIVIDDKSFTLERGDALIYKGCDFIHKRDEFHGDYHMQAFLHYVDKQGPNKEWHLDKRLMLGMPPNK